MFRIEIHPGEGGDDAGLFADELAHAVAVHVGTKVADEGRLRVVASPHRL